MVFRPEAKLPKYHEMIMPPILLSCFSIETPIVIYERPTLSGIWSKMLRKHLTSLKIDGNVSVKGAQVHSSTGQVTVCSETL